jgi:predicted transposase/invertase (TIGR01784 family)
VFPGERSHREIKSGKTCQRRLFGIALIMPTSSPHVHDRFFKQIFTRPENVRDFIAAYLPAGIAGHLDLEVLEVVSGSYVESDLSEYFSDVVVRTTVKQGNPADLYFLFEHKSGPERYARVQVLQYMASRWYAQVRDGQSGPLSLIIPVVIYHGTRLWNYSLEFGELFEPPSSDFLP